MFSKEFISYHFDDKTQEKASFLLGLMFSHYEPEVTKEILDACFEGTSETGLKLLQLSTTMVAEVLRMSAEEYEQEQAKKVIKFQQQVGKN